MPPSYVLDTQTDSLSTSHAQYVLQQMFTCVRTGTACILYWPLFVKWANGQRWQQAPHPIVTTVIYRSPKLLPFKHPDHQPLTIAFKQKYHNFKWPHPHPSLTPPPQPWPTKVLHPFLLNKVCITCSMIYKIYYLYDVPRFYTAPIGIRYNLCWYVYALVL